LALPRSITFRRDPDLSNACVALQLQKWGRGCILGKAWKMQDQIAARALGGPGGSYARFLRGECKNIVFLRDPGVLETPPGLQNAGRAGHAERNGFV
jgi:hypothetical protein